MQETKALVLEKGKDVEVLVCEVDMLKESDIERMVRETVGKWGRLDYAVNAAGLFLHLEAYPRVM